MEIAARAKITGHRDCIACKAHVFDHDHRVGAVRQDAAGQDARGRPTIDAPAEGPARGRFADHAQRLARVHRPHRESVDRAGGEGGQLGGRAHVRRQDAAHRLADGNALFRQLGCVVEDQRRRHVGIDQRIRGRPHGELVSRFRGP